MDEWHPSKRSGPICVHNLKKKNRTLQEAFVGKSWIKNLNLLYPFFSAQHFVEFMQLWMAIQWVNLRPHIHDEIHWKLNKSGQHSTSSVYHTQFIGAINTSLNEIIWSAWTPPKSKFFSFFSWLVVQDRIWTADRLRARDCPHNPVCALCHRVPESGKHLFSECRFIRRIWDDLST